MYDKFYNFIIPSFQDVELCTTDTDSFLFSCKIPENESITSLLKKHEGKSYLLIFFFLKKKKLTAKYHFRSLWFFKFIGEWGTW